MDIGDPKPGTVFINGATGQEYEFIAWHYVEYGAAISRYAAWGSHCTDCGLPIAIISPDKPRWFRRRCATCAERNLSPASRDGVTPRLVQRLGAIERRIMDVASAQFRAMESVRYDDIAMAVVASLPAPEEGVRDTRRARVLRALNNLNEKDGLLEIVNGRVVFTE